MTTSRPEVHELLERYDLRPSRALGQNFVADANTVRRIARLSGAGPNTPVVEIGAGLGALTVALADTGATVTAVEVDHRLLPALRDVTAERAVRVVEADALSVDWPALLASSAAGTAPVTTVVGNLPYNVAVGVVMRVLDEAPTVQTMLVLLQREVAERLVATPGTKAYGAVTVHVAYHATARVVGRVPAAVFVPRPKVESSLVRIERRAVVAVDPAVVPAEALFALVRTGFAQRRKMLRRALAGVVAPEGFAAAGIDPEARAETLSVEDWGRLATWASAPSQ